MGRHCRAWCLGLVMRQRDAVSVRVAVFGAGLAGHWADGRLNAQRL